MDTQTPWTHCRQLVGARYGLGSDRRSLVGSAIVGNLNDNGYTSTLLHSHVETAGPLRVVRTQFKEAQMTDKVINIVSVAYKGGYRLHLEFDDATVQVVDFEPFLQRSTHHDIRAYLDPDRFAAYRLVYGELVWGDYGLCFPMADLHANQIEKRSPMEANA